MKNMFRFSALVCASVAFFASCVEETFETAVPALDGDEIVFGARAGFENDTPGTKTEYSGEDYEYNGSKFERIDWVHGKDIIEVYCPQTEMRNAHYDVLYNNVGPDELPNEGELTSHLKDYAYLAKKGEVSLQWNGDGVHQFYALYPSASMFNTTDEDGNEVTVDMGIEMDGTKLTGIVPTFQNPVGIDYVEGYGYIAKPDMRYAYMAAYSTASRTQGSVGLTFVPIVTAVEVELTLADNGDEKPFNDVYIGEIQVATPKDNNGNYTQHIAGGFTAELKDWDGTGYPACQLNGVGKGEIQITTRKYNEATKIEEPLKLSQGESLKFTVFLLPTANIKDLVIRFSMDGAVAYKGKTLTGSEIKAHYKTRITNLSLPAVLPEDDFVWDASNWMSQLDQQTQLRKLSLPGTGGTFSSGYTGSNPNYYKSQSLTLDEQWAMGIRAFEVVCDRVVSGGFLGWGESDASLANAAITCAKESVGTTFGTVMKDLINRVAPEDNPNSKECAVVILTYQPVGSSLPRDAAKFANCLKIWYDELGQTEKDVFETYSPDMTLLDAQRKILVVVRINQKDEKEGGNLGGTVQQGITNFTTATNTLSTYPFVLVNGCGTAKDRWGARGYKINGTRVPDISNSSSGNSIIETFMGNGYLYTSKADSTYTDSYTSGDYTVSRAKADTPSDLNFGFATNNPNVTCWYQDWSRVVAAPQQSNGVYWFESYFEKLSNAKTTYDMAVSDLYSNYIFINSLSGYLTTDSFSDSLTPSTGMTYGGSGGDIKGLADKLNPDFYTYVLKRSKDNTTGPTGVVMMDYLSNNPDDGGAYYLPGLIIANNKKYN